VTDQSGSRLRSALSEVRTTIGGTTAEADEEQVSTGTRHADTAEEADETLPLDLAFEILKNGRRRMVLEELAAAEGEITLSDLSETIAARENDKTVAEISSEERKRVYVGLYQAHLPKMDDAGVVQFNKDRGLIRAGMHGDLLERYLGSPTASRPVESPTPQAPPSRRTERVTTTLLLGLLVALSLTVGTVSGVPVALMGLVVLLGLSVLLTVTALIEA
jgi:hypothetical protein